MTARAAATRARAARRRGGRVSRVAGPTLAPAVAPWQRRPLVLSYKFSRSLPQKLAKLPPHVRTENVSETPLECSLRMLMLR